MRKVASRASWTAFVAVLGIPAMACSLAAVGACANGSTIEGSGGDSDGGAAAADTSSGATKTSVTSGQGVTNGTSVTAQASNGTTVGAVTSTTGAVTNGVTTGSGQPCVAPNHQCGATCKGNTPDTGCYDSASCTACAAAPTNGTLTCSSTGQCDFTCGANYVKNGGSCQCALQCCAPTDCPSGVCNAGTCQPVQPTCDQTSCAAGCIAQCIIQGKVGVGICISSNCICACT